MLPNISLRLMELLGLSFLPIETDILEETYIGARRLVGYLPSHIQRALME